VEYHEDPKIDNKIRSGLVWFDIETQKLSLWLSLRLLDGWVEVLVDFEEYEMAEALIRYRKEAIFNKLRENRRSRRKLSQHLRLLGRIYKMKIKSKIKNIV
jgi:hypothetical protein